MYNALNCVSDLVILRAHTPQMSSSTDNTVAISWATVPFPKAMNTGRYMSLHTGK